MLLHLWCKHVQDCTQKSIVHQVIKMETHSRLLKKQSCKQSSWWRCFYCMSVSEGVCMCVFSIIASCFKTYENILQQVRSASCTQTITEHEIVLIISLSAFHAYHVTQRILACIPSPIHIPKIHLIAKTTSLYAQELPASEITIARKKSLCR